MKRTAKLRIRDYADPLGILAAGEVGIALLCGVSAMAMGDLNRYVPMTIIPLNIVDLAISNLETAVALTEQVVTVFVPTETIVATRTASITPLPSDTVTPSPTLVPTRSAPTRTRRPREIATRTSTPRPTRTATRVPTRTPSPIPPPDTDTPGALPTVQIVLTSNATEREAAILTALVKEQIITQEQAEAFTDIHDRLGSAGLMP